MYDPVVGTRRLQADRSVPIQPIVDWWRLAHSEHRRSNCVCIDGGLCSSYESLARTVGVSHSTMYRRLRLGIIDVYEADQWAAAVGYHVTRLWPRWDRVDCFETHDDIAELLPC